MALSLAPRLGAADVSGPALRTLYDRYDLSRMSLVDRGFVAGVHPLDLWLVGFSRASTRIRPNLAASRVCRRPRLAGRDIGWALRVVDQLHG
jgi:hypothetical protein